MDFGTVRKKLSDGAYKNLEELEVCFQLSEMGNMIFNDIFVGLHLN